MIPLKIRLEGDFWDCQIYRGYLYLFCSNGSLKIVDWNSLVWSFIRDPIDELVLTFGFLDGRKLYDSNTVLLLKHPKIRTTIKEAFENLSLKQFEISSDILGSFVVKETSNPFQELQTDSEIFSNKIFGLTYAGLLAVDVQKSSKTIIEKQAIKLNDFVAYSTKASYGKLAMSGGDEGLYEFKVYGNELPVYSGQRLRNVSTKHSSFADYNFISLYNSSLVGDSFLALHKWKDRPRNSKEKPSTVMDREITEESIFGGGSWSAVSWGTNEKIYRATGNVLEVINFNNSAQEEDYFSQKQSFQFQGWKGRILKGGTAYYGAIIECENALVILMEEDDFYNIPGAITRWRVYPRSLNYENHLHVIQDHWLDIYSFNNDYFRMQKKTFGIQYVPERKYKNYR